MLASSPSVPEAEVHDQSTSTFVEPGESPHSASEPSVSLRGVTGGTRPLGFSYKGANCTDEAQRPHFSTPELRLGFYKGI